MMDLFFGSLWAKVSTALVIIVGIFIAYNFFQRDHIKNWRVRIIVLFFMGLALCFGAVFRDGYIDSLTGGQGLFALESFQITLASILGGLILLTMIVSFFLKNQQHLRLAFFFLSIIIIIKIITIELSRILM